MKNENSGKSMGKSISVFKNIEVLLPEYIPLYLPHREPQLRMLEQIFRPLLTDPGSVFIRAMLIGGVGVGKTVTARVFSINMKKLALENNIDLKYVHVNCHRDRTLYEVVSEIIRQTGAPIPLRGLSPREMLLALLSYLERHKQYVIITLDEFDYFIRTAGNDAVYFLVRLYDEYPDAVKRLHYIFISRDITVLGMLDSATENYMLKHLIKFEPYKSYELYDILIQRRDGAFYEGTVDDDIIRYIAEHEGVDRGGEGNARSAIEILRLAGNAADSEGVQRVSIEHVRKAIAIVHPDVVRISDELYNLDLHELLLLKAIVRTLKEKNAPEVKIGDVEEEYRYICQLYGVEPRKHTQVYEYINNLKHMEIIQARVSEKGYRGRTTLIKISTPLEPLERRIDELIEKRKR